MRKLILRSFLSPGDMVMLTAALRDLHSCYPGKFLTDVRTACPDLWENNPYITPLTEDDSVEVVDCSYPLIDRCNEEPVHCLNGYIEFLNQYLGLSVKLTSFKGDIHLSPLEKSWYSQVYELTREDVPFWIVAAGGKYDVTIKWWSTERYHQVIDHFRGRIQFVQVGQDGHHHPKLNGAIDLRGKTSLRELIRLVYHAAGVLCPVTALMHLAAAVESKRCRPCVVVAGGREPVHWEAYPGHKFLHAIGRLSCCETAGCWHDRVLPLGDGDPRDEHLCVDVRGTLPRCMDLIRAEDVIEAIEDCLREDGDHSLTESQQRAAQRAVRRSSRNEYDEQPLHLSSARGACEKFVAQIPPDPETSRGRGIVICAGGLRYFPGAWVCIHMLRQMGCSLPVEVWHLGPKELDDEMASLLHPLNVKCVDALQVRKRHPVRLLAGWELKAYSLVHSSFQEILFLDADNVPVLNPETLFETQSFKETGAIFWPDYGCLEKTAVIWKSCGLEQPAGPEFETGQMLVDKKRCWEALSLALWFNAHSDFYYQYLHGDKETFHLAFERAKKSYVLIETPPQSLAFTMCQHDPQGRRMFQHRNTDKWVFEGTNAVVDGFLFEDDCRHHLAQLRRQWCGEIRSSRPAKTQLPQSRELALTP